MTERIAYLEAVVGADITDFRRGMQDVRRDTGLLSDTLGGISNIGRSLTFGLTIPLVAIGTAAAAVATQFDASMRNINSIAQLNEAQFQQLKQTVMEFGAATVSGPQKVAESLYEVYSAGVQGAQAMELMKESVHLAEGGLSDLKATTNALTMTMLSYSDSSMTAAQASNIWTRMVQLGVGSLQDFLSNTSKIVPLAHTLGITFQDLAATTAYFSQVGGGAAKAEVAIAMAMSNLLKPTKALQTEYDKLGVTTGVELVSKFGSLGGALKALRDDMSDADFFKSFSKTGLQAALSLTDNFDQLQASIGQFNKGLDTATQTAWDQQMKSWASETARFTSALQGAGISIGSIIMQMAGPVLGGLTDVLLVITKLPPEVTGAAVAFGALLAAVGPVLWILGSILTPVGLIIAAVGTLAIAISQNFGGIKDTITNAINTVLGPLSDLKTTVTDFFTALFGNTDQQPTDITDTLPTVTVDPMKLVKINPTTTDISLWQFFSDEGFSASYSWSDFMDAAEKGGWSGGAIKAGDVLSFMLPDPNAVASQVPDYTKPITDAWTGEWLKANATYPTDDSFGTRLSNAISTSWPKISTALVGMWNNVKNWFTTEAIPKLDNVGSSVMDAIAGWFSSGDTASGTGNIYNVVRGMFNQAPDAVNKLVGGFPEMQTALGNLAHSFGKWLEDSAIPTLARSVGYILGTIAVGIGELMGQVWNLIKPGGTANQGVGQAAEGASKSLFTPFSEGFKDALKDNNVQGGIDSFVTGLAGLIAGAFALNVLGGAILKVSILGWISKYVSAAFAGEAVTQIAGSAVGGTTGGLFTGLTSALSTLFLNPITIGILLGLYIGNIPEVQQAIRGFVDRLFGKGTSENIGKGFEDWVNSEIERYKKMWTDTAAAATPTDVSIPINPGVTLPDGTKVGAGFDWTAYLSDQLHIPGFGSEQGQTLTTAPVNVTVPTGQLTVDLNGIDLSNQQNLPQPNAMGIGGGQLAGGSVAGSIATIFVTGITNAISTEVQNKKADLQTAANQITEPFSNTLLPYMSEGGAPLVALNNFTKTFVDKFSLLGKTLPGLVNPIVGAIAQITKAALDAANAVSAAAVGLANLGNTTPGSGKVGTEPGNGHASGGTLQGFGVVGERGPEPVYFGNSGTVLPTRMFRDAMAGGEGKGNSVVLNIYGTTSFDDIISEAKRRGYDIEAMRK